MMLSMNQRMIGLSGIGQRGRWRGREREREICQQEAVEKNHHVHMFPLLPILAIIGKRGNM